ncbi:unnamed protein product [Didymodactylos carnosus]|uniref:Uncharacterized protein n=1 Tax=Didymodactylos carnosus TaxID=1234261 RepID=A0A816EHV1_9BILA|nr:unnamed protein product [Didymodactylos carnosus]CAF1648131.1 unnamed protein product [Didymodactylos carnosus]CAF4367843.1 unnamed protein product [Didymodactylos carnosus]CAF4571073.1 unnamed protein product [Didymodactylos carnosus]
MGSTCKKCGNLKKFDSLFECNDDDGGEDLSYFQWETDESRMVKIEKPGTVQDAIKNLKNKTKQFLMHSFVTSIQYLHFQECKPDVNKTSIVLQFDFSENYRTSYQDEIQNAFFNYNQVGLFIAVGWSGSGVINYVYILGGYRLSTMLIANTTMRLPHSPSKTWFSRKRVFQKPQKRTRTVLNEA